MDLLGVVGTAGSFDEVAFGDAGKFGGQIFVGGRLVASLEFELALRFVPDDWGGERKFDGHLARGLVVRLVLL